MINSIVTRIRRALRPENGNRSFGFHRIEGRDAGMIASFVAAFVASRLAWVYLNLDTSLYWEESYRWISALELLNGPVQPSLDYQADHYQGGSLVMILLSLPLLRVLGESMVAMKLTAILFSSVILSLVYIVGLRLFGRTTALIAALAYLVGPPLVAYWGLVVMGSHHESVLFSVLQILVFVELLSGNWRTSTAWVLFGFISGAGVWFCYTSGLSLVACGLTWLLLEGLPRRRELAAALLGTLAGLAPWFVYNATRGFVGLRRIIEIFGYGNPIDTWEQQSRAEKVIQLVSHDLPLGLVLPFDTTWSSWVTLPLITAFVIPLTAAVAIAVHRVGDSFLRAPERTQRTDGWIELVFIVYGGVFLAFFLSSQFTVDRNLGAVSYRLFLAPAVLMMIPAARTAAIGFRSGVGMRRVALTGCVLYLAASTCGTLLLATRHVEPMSDDADWMSAGHMTRGVLLHRKYETDIAQSLAGARLVRNPELRFRVLQGIGWGMQYRFETSDDLGQIEQDLAAIPSRERFAVLSGLRGFANVRLGQLGQRLVSSDPALKPELVTQARRIRGLVTYADEKWRTVPPRFRALSRIPDPATVATGGHAQNQGTSAPEVADWHFKEEVAAAQSSGDPRQKFRSLQEVGGWLVACFEDDGNLERVQNNIDSIPIEVSFAVLSGLRFYSSVRMREAQEILRDGGNSAEDRLRLERLKLLTEYGNVQWDQIPPAYRWQNWVASGERPATGR